MVIGVDESGVVRLVGNGGMPEEWNGLTLTAHELTPEQDEAYNALPADRSGMTFTNGTLAALPAKPVVVPARKVSPLEAALIKKGVIAKADVDAEDK